MKTERKLVFQSRELPLPLEIVGENGEREIYMLTPAGRKFGACLCKPGKLVRQILLKSER